MKVILSRHGETEVNSTGGLETPKTNSKLTKKGLRQAHELALKLALLKIDAIYSSDSNRAVATAEIVAKSHNLKVIIDTRLREYNAGDFYNYKDGFEKFNENKLTISKKKRINPLEVIPKNGESEMQHFERVKSFIKAVEDSSYKNIVIISHSGTNEIFFIVSGIFGWEQRYKLKQNNCCINEVIYLKNKWSLKEFNLTDHLSER